MAIAKNEIIPETQQKKEEKDKLLPIEQQRQTLEDMNKTLKRVQENVNEMVKTARDAGKLLFSREKRRRLSELTQIQRNTETIQKRVDIELENVKKFEKRNDPLVNKKIKMGVQSIEKDLENLFKRVKSIQERQVEHGSDQHNQTVPENAFESVNRMIDEEVLTRKQKKNLPTSIFEASQKNNKIMEGLAEKITFPAKIPSQQPEIPESMKSVLEQVGTAKNTVKNLEKSFEQVKTVEAIRGFSR